MGIYEELGVKKVINCVSTSSSLGSSVNRSPQWPEVMDAVMEASRHFVCINELLEKSGKIIAEITGAEAALITPGCAAALTLATAACMTKDTELEKYVPSTTPTVDYPPYPYGSWSHKAIEILHQLPNTTGLKNEVIQQKCHSYTYTRCVRATGAKIIWAGTPDNCSIEQIEDAINENTAAILFAGLYRHLGVPIQDVLKISKKRNVPLIFDASYTLPPKENLKKWILMGCDIVCHSGGKSIGGPSSTGWLMGRKDLVKLAWLQTSPQHGIGRGFKVDRTQIVALIKSLQLYVAKDINEEFKASEVKAAFIVKELKKIPCVQEVNYFVPTTYLLQGWPVVRLILDEDKLGMKTSEVVNQLYQSNPPIWTYYDHKNYCPGGIVMNTENLAEGQEKIVVDTFKTILRR